MTPVPPLGPVFIGLNLIRGKNPHVVKPEMGQDAQQTNKYKKSATKIFHIIANLIFGALFGSSQNALEYQEYISRTKLVRCEPWEGFGM